MKTEKVWSNYLIIFFNNTISTGNLNKRYNDLQKILIGICHSQYVYKYHIILKKKSISNV